MEPDVEHAWMSGNRPGPGSGARRAEHGERAASPASPSGAVALHPWDGYLTGPENELAMAAAQAMARGERQGISPLVVHGPSGVGKSRLLAGLVAERLRRQPGSTVAHLDAETFAAAVSRRPASRGSAAGRRCGAGSAPSICSCSKTWRAWSAPPIGSR